MLHTRFVSRAVLGAISLSQGLCLCLPTLSSCLRLHLPFPSLLTITIILLLLIIRPRSTTFIHCLAVKPDPQLPGNRVAQQSAADPGFSCLRTALSARPRPVVCHSVAGQIGPFLFTLSPPRLVRHRRVPVTLASSHWSRLETRHLPVLFFSPPLSPLKVLCFSGFAGTSTKFARP